MKFSANPTGDPKLPFLPKALDPREVARLIAPLAAQVLANPADPADPGDPGDPAKVEVELRQVRLVRHKPGRRCVIEYHFGDRRRSELPAVSVYAKLRARGADRTTHALMHALHRSGLRVGKGLAAVPEPVGIVPALHMTLQRGAPGLPFDRAVTSADGAGLMSRVAEAIHALHATEIEWERRHAMSDELRILRERLDRLSRERPEWAERLERLFSTCAAVASSVPEVRPRGIHRDFHPDQLIVDGPTVYLLDLDLYALGDPALDVGNFLGHLVEQGLRLNGDPKALAELGETLAERFLQLTPGASRSALESYTVLSMARLVQISSVLPERRRITEALLELCEERLGIPSQKFTRARTSPR